MMEEGERGEGEGKRELMGLKDGKEVNGIGSAVGVEEGGRGICQAVATGLVSQSRERKGKKRKGKREEGNLEWADRLAPI
jgi:hypothetical protein